MWEKAVTGIAGAATLYTMIAVVLTCCLAGITIFGVIGILLEVAFIGAMIAVAWFTRHGARACRGQVITPLGTGPVSLDDTQVNNIVTSVGYRDACRLNKAAFAVSIIAIFFFLVTAIMQILLMKSHKKNKRLESSRANGYDHGYATEKKPRFWQRKRKTTTVPNHHAYNNATTGTAVGAGAAGLAVPATHNARASRDTNYISSTVGGNDDAAYLDKAEKGDYTPPATNAAPLPNSAYAGDHGHGTAPASSGHHHRAPSHGDHTHAPLHNAVHSTPHREQPYQYAPTTFIPQISTTTTTNTNTRTY
jgi:hypothetical protein